MAEVKKPTVKSNKTDADADADADIENGDDCLEVSERSSMCESESASSVTNYNYSGPSSVNDKHLKTKNDDREYVVVVCDGEYLKSCDGAIRLFQVVMSIASLLSLVTCAKDGNDFLQLPLSWHFRVMVFVLILTSVFSLTIWTFHVTSLVIVLPINWWMMDMVLYSVFSFFYLVGSSLVASAFDFYQKIDIGIPHSTIQQLVVCVIFGYICMFLYGLTAYIGYKRWRAQHHLFRRRRLLEEEEDEYLNV